MATNWDELAQQLAERRNQAQPAVAGDRPPAAPAARHTRRNADGRPTGGRRRARPLPPPPLVDILQSSTPVNVFEKPFGPLTVIE